MSASTRKALREFLATVERATLNNERIPQSAFDAAHAAIEPWHSFPSTMHCPHGEHAVKHLGGGAFGSSCKDCDPNGDRVALLLNSPEVEAIGLGRNRYQVSEAQLEKLGKLVDRIDNLVHAEAIPMPEAIRVIALSKILPDVHSELKSLYVEIAGDDPWADPPSSDPPR
jgi:hypothetical protein